MVNKIKHENLYNNIMLDCGRIDTTQAEAYYSNIQSDVKDTLTLLNDKLEDMVTDGPFAPAEIASLWKLGLNKDQDRVVLLYSDTPEGIFCARVLALYINQHIAQCELGDGSDKDVRKIKGLQVKDANEFKQTGLNELKNSIENITEMYRQIDERILNITGGFKVAIPYLTVLAWDYLMVIIYLYEESDSLIEIKKPANVGLRVNFDEVVKNTSIQVRPPGYLGRR
jgi:putative CRISPR-associated protein (TIGR02619 family)